MRKPIPREELYRDIGLVLERHPLRLSVRKLSLFGSYVHGTASAESDVDLLVEFKKPVSLLKLIGMQQDFEDALHRKVDLQTPASLSRYFRDEVLASAQTVYEG